MLKDFELTRQTNNPVEWWFGHLKNHILHKLKVTTSELACHLYNRLESKVEPQDENHLIEKTKNQKSVKRLFLFLTCIFILKYLFFSNTTNTITNLFL